MTGSHWLALFALIVLGWTLLYAMALPQDLRAAGQLYGSGLLASLCIVTPDAAGFLRMVLMWSLMSGAMMAPTALPAFATYDELAHTGKTRFWRLVAGYLLVWIGFAVAAASLQMGLFQANLLTAFGDSNSGLLSAALLIAAGAYQFSPLKESCLSKCRAPLGFFVQHWDEGPFLNGLRLGAVCLGCCWALMLLAFVGGVMNLVFMVIAMILMTLEKLPDLGRYLTRPMGLALILGGAFIGVQAL